MLPAELSATQTQTASSERRVQIDDFLRLLEAARSAAEAGEPFSVALLAPAAVGSRNAVESNEDESGYISELGDAEAAQSAHEFLRLNLRRADSLAFYGPTLLVALLPRRYPTRSREDLERLIIELEENRPGVRLAFGLASFPADGHDVETLIERAEAELLPATARGIESVGTDEEATAPGSREQFHSDGGSDQISSPPGNGRVQEFLPRERPDSDVQGMEFDGTSVRQAASEQSPASARPEQHTDFAASRVVRESRRGDGFAAALPYSPAAGAAGGVLGRAAAEAATRERERRRAGERMPRRVLLTVSDPVRMAQINLLLRSAAYEVRAAFDGAQALDLLRIERADLLVIDYELKEPDGLSVLRKLNERHRSRLPMPVLMLLPPDDSGRLREEAQLCGATGFVQLPCDPAELLECARTTGTRH